MTFGQTLEEHDVRLHRVLKKIKAAGITLNKSKCEFRKESLSFLGHKIDKTGISADPSKLMAVSKMGKPKTRTELRRFLGMSNQLGKFSPHLEDISKPLRVQRMPGYGHDTAFQLVKQELTKPVVLALYDPSAELKVCSDASAYGVLMQKESSFSFLFSN